jgi:uncharacterized protein GlcG (DUF336 family)
MIQRDSKSPRPGLRRRLQFEQLEGRQLLAANPWHNEQLPSDVNADQRTNPQDALLVIRAIQRGTDLGRPPEGESAAAPVYLDVNNDWKVTPHDVLSILLRLRGEGAPPPCVADPADDPSELTKEEVCKLLRRAAAASATEDAIIAIADRGGRILGVRAEKDVLLTYAGDDAGLVFAVDGAVAKARTAAFFSSSQAPITSRTIRFISQSTITQREVESNPNIADPASPLRGPGFVAPIGIGGHFPPEVLFTPPVDLFGIERQSRDSRLHPGADGIKGTADDLTLTTRFDVDPAFVPAGVELEFPESYGRQSGKLLTAQSRGIATLPGGIPLYKMTAAGKPRLVGGIGVFFPGDDGFASHEQGFVPAVDRGGVPQTELERTNAARVLESEWIAFAAAGGTASVLGSEPLVPGISLAFFERARIDLVGVTLEVFGPHPTRAHKVPGPERLLEVGIALGVGTAETGTDLDVAPGAILQLAGKSVADGWLVEPHDSSVDPLTAADVKRMIEQGIVEAERTRSAIRLTDDLRPGARTRMVFAVSDTSDEVLGLYRMPDAPIFSIDVSVAKARNTSYYASGAMAADLIDDDGDGVPDDTNADGVADSLARALTNRTFRFLALPRFPSGAAEGTRPGAFSILLAPGIHPLTAENLGAPLPAAVYGGPDTTVMAFDSFFASRNFQAGGDLTRQNGIVFFPGSAPIYGAGTLVGGLGVSGDGVDQDDVVTAASVVGFEAPLELRADQIFVRGVRLPYIKFLRNPTG